MKLFYFKAPQGNVGDDLNAWLWPKILSTILDDDHDHLLVGIGTLLNHKIPPARKYTVLTSGVGYGDLPNIHIGEWNYIGLRGPLSQKMLGVKGNISLLDGAYLLPLHLPQQRQPIHKLAYIPHVDSMIYGLWQDVTDIAGIKLIDPRWPVEKFVAEVCSCERIIAEAMHGAIISDAYGVPWQPTRAYDYINEFKWNDWANSLDMNVHLNVIGSTWKGDNGGSLKRKTINTTKIIAKLCGVYPDSWSQVRPHRSTWKTLERTAKELLYNASKREFYLSNEKLKGTKTDFLLDCIERKLFLR